jgi:hypothetical protein
MPGLQDEIADLRRQLAEKDRRIEDLKSQITTLQADLTIYQSENARVDETLKAILQQLLDETPRQNIQYLGELERIVRSPELPSQIQGIYDYVRNQASSIIHKLSSQLKGHVDFLTRLASSPELQSLFLVSDRSGQIFLPETARSLLLEQAARTSEWLGQIGENGIRTSIGDLASVLDPNFEFSDRFTQISHFIEQEPVEKAELASLFLQEVLITSILRRFLQKSTPAKTSDVQPLLDLLAQALDYDVNTLSSNDLEHLVRKLAKQVIHAKCNWKVEKQAAPCEDWVQWARRLYAGLTGLDANVNDSSLRILIEEAALTTLGTQVLQKRLRSLRLQKAVMEPPLIKKKTEIGFTPSLIVVVACTRLLKAAGALPACMKGKKSRAV